MSSSNVEPDSAGPVGEFRPGVSRGSAGFHHVDQAADGRWWWVDPAGRPMLVRAVNDIGPGPAGTPYAEWLATRVGGEEQPTLAAHVARRLTAWGFNAVGPGAPPGAAGAMQAQVVTVGFRHPEGPGFRLGGVNLPDVFDPRWAEFCDARAAAVTATWRERSALLGYQLDDGINWGAPEMAAGDSPPARPTLLQVCLSLEPSHAAFHAAWEFVLAPHGGDWSALARAWTWPAGLARAGLREWTREDHVLNTPGFWRDNHRFTREFARRYLAATTTALRREDPHHLILGPRCAGTVPAAVLTEMTPTVDVIWLAARDLLAGRGPASDGPVWVDDFSWAQPDCRRDTGAELSDLEQMLQGGRAALGELLLHPGTVAYSWAAWRAGVPRVAPPWPVGLVTDEDEPVWAHTEPLTALHRVIETLRAGDSAPG